MPGASPLRITVEERSPPNFCHLRIRDVGLQDESGVGVARRTRNPSKEPESSFDVGVLRFSSQSPLSPSVGCPGKLTGERVSSSFAPSGLVHLGGPHPALSPVTRNPSAGLLLPLALTAAGPAQEADPVLSARPPRVSDGHAQASALVQAPPVSTRTRVYRRVLLGSATTRADLCNQSTYIAAHHPQALLGCPFVASLIQLVISMPEP